MNPRQQRPNNQIGAGWLKSSSHGEFISISFFAEALQNFDLANCLIMMAPNAKKAKETHPDYIITAKAKEVARAAQNPQAPVRSVFPKPANSFAPPRQAPQQPGYGHGMPDDEEIPF